MKRLKHSLLLLPFIVAAIFSFSPHFSDSDGHKVGKYYISIPYNLPLNNGLLWALKKGDTLTISQYNSREYQIEVDIDSTEIWDGDKLIGKIPYDSTSNLDKLINKDNE